MVFSERGPGERFDLPKAKGPDVHRDVPVELEMDEKGGIVREKFPNIEDRLSATANRVAEASSLKNLGARLYLEIEHIDPLILDTTTKLKIRQERERDDYTVCETRKSMAELAVHLQKLTLQTISPDLRTWTVNQLKDVAEYLEQLEATAVNRSYMLDSTHTLETKVFELASLSFVELEIAGPDGRINLKDFGRSGVDFFLGEENAATRTSVMIARDKDSGGLPEDFSKQLFVVLHELGHTHQDWGDSVKQDLALSRPNESTSNTDTNKIAREKLAVDERNAWARALAAVRDLRKRGVDVLAPYGSQAEAFEKMRTSLGTYEVGSLEKFGDTFGQLFLKRDIPSASYDYYYGAALKQEVLEAIKNGLKVSEAQAEFDVSDQTIHAWLKS